MPSPAQTYLATLSPAQQQEVHASLASSGSTLQQWFQAAVDAGVPGAIQAAGGSQVDPTGGGPQAAGIGGWAMGASGTTSDWLGKRNPTPSELRQYAKEQGWSEDFGRFSDGQVAAWIKDSWDVGASKFRSYHAPQGAGQWAFVEKPTESVRDPSTGDVWGPWGDKMGINLGPGGAKGKAAAMGGGAPQTPANAWWSDAYSALQDPLQAGLYNLAQQRGIWANQGMGDATQAQSLAGGGVWWSDPGAVGQPAAGTPAAPVQKQQKTASPWAAYAPPPPAPAAPAAPAAPTSTGPLETALAGTGKGFLGMKSHGKKPLMI